MFVSTPVPMLTGSASLYRSMASITASAQSSTYRNSLLALPEPQTSMDFSPLALAYPTRDIIAGMTWLALGSWLSPGPYILTGIKEFAKFTGFKEPVTYLGCWATLTRKGRQVFPHTHNFHMVGHVAINAEPSTTTYSWKDPEGKEYHVPIKNLNGQVQVTKSVNHHSSIWEKDESRITIAFDVIGQTHVEDPRPLPPCFPILLE